MKNKRTDGNEYIWIVQVAAIIAVIIGIIALIKSCDFKIIDYKVDTPKPADVCVEEYSTIFEQTETTAEPQTETTTKATTTKAASKQLTVTATGYCPCKKCCGKTDGITASGTKATAGRTIGVDPKVIPYGTKVIINGHTYIAEDTGAIKGNKIDIFFDTHEEAVNFGKQTLTIEIVR